MVKLYLKFTDDFIEITTSLYKLFKNRCVRDIWNRSDVCSVRPVRLSREDVGRVRVMRVA